MEGTPIIIFSHLRWDFVYQRPQHLLSGLSKYHRIYFIEEPVVSQSEQAEWEFLEPVSNVVVCRPHSPCAAHGFHPDQMPYLKKLVGEPPVPARLRNYLSGLYTPMHLRAAEGWNPPGLGS